MPQALLEVIALDATDAGHAAAGGADRVELASDMHRLGLTPTVQTFAAVRAEIDLPIRVMLRQQDGFAAGDLDSLRRSIDALRAAGAEEFVLGFLDASGEVDLASLHAVLAVLDGCAWTFHKALDHATDRRAAWQAIEGLGGLDAVLTSGCPSGVAEGLDTLITEAKTARRPRIVAGGALREHHLAPLLGGGVDAFHTGTAVRRDRTWASPIDPGEVRRWRDWLQTVQ
ncbi:copper homeostasis protein [Krasilnikovia cinnamomea]|uniref:Copper homeostasis protein cutC homolog n=1 Tax=Krasilnikovia cinnamomea TaxID=349313 RepID=A0A4Q7ZPM1_9ACTN|nr:copper homeostasis protein CutC [Krasilnikovia cinnamomea]RZU52365.1 copper homeostasis protein [Krasilnikovia cinnamomea]